MIRDTLGSGAPVFSDAIEMTANGRARFREAEKTLAVCTASPASATSSAAKELWTSEDVKQCAETIACVVAKLPDDAASHAHEDRPVPAKNGSGPRVQPGSDDPRSKIETRHVAKALNLTSGRVRQLVRAKRPAGPDMRLPVVAWNVKPVIFDAADVRAWARANGYMFHEAALPGVARDFLNDSSEK